jgi:uncharacterized membrane protein YccC
MSQTKDRARPLFYLAASAVGLFIITVFALVATVFGEPGTPVSHFLNEYGGTLIGWEAAAACLLGVLAMTVDRRQTLRRLREAENAELSTDKAVPPIASPDSE